MADYKEAYKKMIIELTEAIDELTRVRNNAVKFIIKAKNEETHESDNDDDHLLDINNC